MDTKKYLLSTLLYLKERAETPSILSAGGICCAVETFGAREELRKVIARWPESSGDVYYPVPDPERRDDAEAARAAYYRAARTACMWGAGEYAQARRRLLDFCIAELAADLSSALDVEQMRVPSYIGTDANYEAIKATTPTTCCPCGQVPVCHGLRSCGKSSA